MSNHLLLNDLLIC